MLKLLKKLVSRSKPLAPAATRPGGPNRVPSSHDEQDGDCESYKNRGNKLLGEGKLDEAAQCYRRAVSVNPNHAESHINLGYVFTKQKRYRDAESHLKRAAQIDPANVDVFFMLGNLAQEQGHVKEAKDYFAQSLALKPHFDIAFRIFLTLERYDEALASCDDMLDQKPAYPDAHVNRGIALCALGRHEDALRDFTTARQHSPQNAEVHFHLALALNSLGRLEAAIESYEKAIFLKPDYADAHNNLGTILLKLNRYDAALVHISQALTILPDRAETLLNQGAALLNLHRHTDALASWAKALTIKPDHAEVHYNESLCRLQLGDFELGWQKYEWRWKNAQLGNRYPDYTQPLWLGNESLTGKTILLHAEQGLGDTIQFCRYAKLLSAQGATVIALVQASLKSLLTGVDGLAKIISVDQKLPPFDYHCPLLSLPLAFKTTLDTIPNHIPYLTASAALTQRIRDELPGEKDGFKIGVCWKGNTSYAADAQRSPGSAPFKNFMSGFADSRAKFYTLLPDSRNIFSDMGGEDLGYELDQHTAPFAETAALIMNLDLVITCDTSIGHVAGALGKPVWLVLPFSTDWRWVINREDSPWYPATRLIRQTSPGDWDELFTRVALRLNDVLRGSSSLIWNPDHAQQANRPDDNDSSLPLRP